MEQFKPQLNTPIQPQPGNTDAILEASLMHRDKTSKETQVLKEAEIMQREKHQQEKIPLMEAQLQMQAQTIKVLEQLVEKIGTLDVNFKELLKKEKVKSFTKKESGEKKKLELTGEISTAFKELKTKLNYYTLLLNHL